MESALPIENGNTNRITYAICSIHISREICANPQSGYNMCHHKTCELNVYQSAQTHKHRVQHLNTARRTSGFFIHGKDTQNSEICPGPRDCAWLSDSLDVRSLDSTSATMHHIIPPFPPTPTPKQLDNHDRTKHVSYRTNAISNHQS